MKKLAAIAIAASLALALFVPTAAQAAATVTMSRSKFQPATKSVNRGTKVVWSNTSGVLHNVKSTSGNWSKSKNIGPGDKTSYTFNSNGTYRYKCTKHAGMDGKIVVG